MPDYTNKLNLPKPLGNEAVTRAAHITLVEAIEAAAGAAGKLATLDPNGDVPDGQIPASIPRLGTNNQSITKDTAIRLETDTRSKVLTYTNGSLTKVEEKDGAAVIKTTDLAYDGSGNLQTVTVTAGGSVVTTTLGYTSGVLSSVSKAVS